jgi:hypothetical protein
LFSRGGFLLASPLKPIGHPPSKIGFDSTANAV